MVAVRDTNVNGPLCAIQTERTDIPVMRSSHGDHGNHAKYIKQRKMEIMEIMEVMEVMEIMEIMEQSKKSSSHGNHAKYTHTMCTSPSERSGQHFHHYTKTCSN